MRLRPRRNDQAGEHGNSSRKRDDRGTTHRAGTGFCIERPGDRDRRAERIDRVGSRDLSWLAGSHARLGRVIEMIGDFSEDPTTVTATDVKTR